MRKADLSAVFVLCLLAVSLFFAPGGNLADAKAKPKAKNKAVKISEKQIWKQVSSYDKNKDRKLSSKERKKVKKIKIRLKSQSSAKLNLKELKYFSNLKTLTVDASAKKTVRVSGTASLKKLTNLETLTILGCRLKKLDISMVQSLHFLTLSSEMGLNGKKLKLYGRGQMLQELCIQYVKGQKTMNLSDFDFSCVQRLEIKPYLRPGETVEKINPDLETIQGGGMYRNLRDLILGKGNVTDLKITAGSYLRRLNCANNKLRQLDIAPHYTETLKEVHCEGNQLTSLDVSNNPKLSYLYCQGNPLTELKVFDVEKAYSPYYPPELKYVGIDRRELLDNAVKTGHTLLPKEGSVYEILYQIRDGDKDAACGSQGWDRSREYTVQSGDTIYYAYLSRDKTRSWIRKIDHLDALTPVKLVLPKTIGGAPVTRLGMDLQLYLSQDWSNDYFDAEMSLFEELFEPWHDEGQFWRTDVKITELVLPKTVTELEAGAFAGLGLMKKINIPPQVTEFKDYLFYNCRALKKLSIPSRVKKISNTAFDGTKIKP